MCQARRGEFLSPVRRGHCADKSLTPILASAAALGLCLLLILLPLSFSLVYPRLAKFVLFLHSWLPLHIFFFPLASWYLFLLVPHLQIDLIYWKWWSYLNYFEQTCSDQRRKCIFLLTYLSCIYECVYAVMLSFPFLKCCHQIIKLTGTTNPYTLQLCDHLHSRLLFLPAVACLLFGGSTSETAAGVSSRSVRENTGVKRADADGRSLWI